MFLLAALVYYVVALVERRGTPQAQGANVRIQGAKISIQGAKVSIQGTKFKG